MPCIVIVIGRDPQKSRLILEAATAVGPMALATGDVTGCGNCKNTSGVTYRTRVPVLFDPKLAEFYVRSFGQPTDTKAQQLLLATTWLQAETDWLDDPNKTVYVIEEAD